MLSRWMRQTNLSMGKSIKQSYVLFGVHIEEQIRNWTIEHPCRGREKGICTANKIDWFRIGSDKNNGRMGIRVTFKNINVPCSPLTDGTVEVLYLIDWYEFLLSFSSNNTHTHTLIADGKQFNHTFADNGHTLTRTAPSLQYASFTLIGRRKFFFLPARSSPTFDPANANFYRFIMECWFWTPCLDRCVHATPIKSIEQSEKSKTWKVQMLLRCSFSQRQCVTYKNKQRS